MCLLLDKAWQAHYTVLSKVSGIIKSRFFDSIVNIVNTIWYCCLFVHRRVKWTKAM